MEDIRVVTMSAHSEQFF